MPPLKHILIFEKHLMQTEKDKIFIHKILWVCSQCSVILSRITRIVGYLFLFCLFYLSLDCNYVMAVVLLLLLVVVLFLFFVRFWLQWLTLSSLKAFYLLKSMWVFLIIKTNFVTTLLYSSFP